MCQPSASSAIEPNALPAAISTSIIVAVIATTHRVPRSARSVWMPKRCECCQRERSSWCVACMRRGKPAAVWTATKSVIQNL
jgi:hypothetical protein